MKATIWSLRPVQQVANTLARVSGARFAVTGEAAGNAVEVGESEEASLEQPSRFVGSRRGMLGT
jgi:hypothetical protein